MMYPKKKINPFNVAHKILNDYKIEELFSNKQGYRKDMKRQCRKNTPFVKEINTSARTTKTNAFNNARSRE